MAISANFTADTEIIQKLDDNPNESDLDAAGLKLAFDTGASNVVKAINSSLIPAINNEITGAISSASTTITATLEGEIGTLANLKTTSKSNLVNAINSLIDELYYKNGDTYTTSSTLTFNGCITNGGKDLYLCIPLPKRLDNITSITFNDFNIVGRSNSGWLNSSSSYFSVLVSPTYSISCGLEQNILSLNIQKNSAYTNVTNNTPVSISIQSLSMTFNKS